MSRTPGMQRRRATGGSGLSGAAASTLTPSWERPTSYHAPRGTASALYGPSADATPSAKYVNKILSEMSLDNPYLASFASDLPAEYLNPARSPASSSSSSTASVSQPYATHGAGEAQLLLGSGAMGSRIAGTSSFARPTPRPHSHHSSRYDAVELRRNNVDDSISLIISLKTCARMYTVVSYVTFKFRRIF